MSSPPSVPPGGQTQPSPSLGEQATLGAGGLPPPPGEARLAAPGYEVLGELGRGGMGVVYMARHLALNRVVALKMLLHGGHAGEAASGRFRAEAEAVARLSHPNIVQVYEVGEHQGLPFLSLEHCAGGSLEKKLAGTPLPPAEAAALVEKLARAVQAAHDANVLHRDLKPANVLLAADGTPKITDFGLARKLDQASQTQTGAVLGTPSYMAPEQAQGKKDIGPAADVYSLGAILYECLTGRPPFKAATTFDTVLQVVGQEPVPPRQLNAKVPRDLETITLKCLQKAPARRYAGAALLAEDLRRWQAGEPIVARPVGAPGRAAKWARRRPAVAALLGVVVLALAAMSAGGVLFTLSLDEARQRAERGEADALAQKALAERREAEANQLRQRAERGEQLAGERLKLARLTSYNIQLLRAGAVSEREPALALALLRDGELCPDEMRDFTHGALVRQCLGGEARALRQPGPVTLLAASADGTVLAASGTDGRGGGARCWGVAVWDVGGERLARVVRVRSRFVEQIALHPRGSHLAYAGRAGDVWLVDLATGRQVELPRRPMKRPWRAGAEALAFSPDGKSLAAGMSARNAKGAWLWNWGEVWLWDVASGRPAGELTGLSGPARNLAFSPDGKSLAAADFTTSGSIWSVGDRARRARFQAPWDWVAGALAFTPDGRSLVRVTATAAHFFDPDSGHLQRSRPLAAASNTHLSFSPDGTRFATVGRAPGAAHVAIHDAATGEARQALAPPSGGVADVRYLGNDLLASCARGAEVYLHRVAPTPGLVYTAREWGIVPRVDEAVRPGVALSPRGDWLAVGGTAVPLGAGGARGAERRRLAGLSNFGPVAWSPDGRWLAAAVARDVRLYALPAREAPPALKGHEQPVTCLAWCPDGALLSGGQDGTVRRWDVKSGRHTVLFRLTGEWDPIAREERNPVERWLMGDATRRSAVRQLAVSPDGKTLAVAVVLVREKQWAQDYRVELWDLEKGRRLRALDTGNQPVRALAFHPDGTALAVGASGPLRAQGASSLVLFPLGPGRKSLAVSGEQGEVAALAFSPDGKALASGGDREGGALRLWCPTTGQLRGELRGHEGKLYDLAFSRDGRWLAGAAESGSRYRFYLWQAAR